MSPDNVLHLPARAPVPAPAPPVDRAAYTRRELDRAVRRLEAVALDMRLCDGLFPADDQGHCNVSLADLRSLVDLIHDGLVDASRHIAEAQGGAGDGNLEYRHEEAVHAALEVVCLIVAALKVGRLPQNGIVAGPVPGAMRLAREKVMFALRAARRAQRA